MNIYSFGVLPVPVILCIILRMANKLMMMIISSSWVDRGLLIGIMITRIMGRRRISFPKSLAFCTWALAFLALSGGARLTPRSRTVPSEYWTLVRSIHGIIRSGSGQVELTCERRKKSINRTFFEEISPNPWQIFRQIIISRSFQSTNQSV